MKSKYSQKSMLVILLATLFLVGYGYLQNNWIDVEYIVVQVEGLPSAFQGYKIVHVSDVHIPRNASSIDHILTIIKEQEPDLIVMTGDIVDKRANFDHPLFSLFCQGLGQIAATYAVSGNHEVKINQGEKWEQLLSKSGVKIIENKIDIINKGNSSLAIMGLKDNQSYKEELFSGLTTIEHMPKILLAHRPELFYTFCSDSLFIKPELVFSGHAHGGQFRIPFINQGLVAPNQGLFPKLTSGLYKANNGVQMVVSRGLGNSIFPLRLNNRPHLPVIYLK